MRRAVKWIWHGRVNGHYNIDRFEHKDFDKHRLESTRIRRLLADARVYD